MAARLTPRKDAKAKGETYYQSGKPCVRGHTTYRYVANGQCWACAVKANQESYERVTNCPEQGPDVKRKQRERNAKWRAANPERARQLSRESARAYRQANPEKHREYQRRCRGLPEPTRPRPEFCECCSGRGRKNGLVLDHSHATGEFRGWLCDGCNTGIGLLGDTRDSVAAAVRYLEKHEGAV